MLQNNNIDAFSVSIISFICLFGFCTGIIGCFWESNVRKNWELNNSIEMNN